MGIDIIFVLGPSGVGKSDLAKALARKLDYEFYEVDQYPADGIDVHGLRREWDEFWLNVRPESLVDLLCGRAAAARKTGIVVGFPSMLTLRGAHLRALNGKVRVVYLVGTEEQCRSAFLAREQKTGRRPDAAHWNRNNKAMFDFLKTPEAKPYIVAAFDDNDRRSTEQILADISDVTSD